MLKGYKIVNDVKPGGTFLLNCQWTVEELDSILPAEVKNYIANNNINFYIVNAIDKAREIGMGKRTNTILQSAFFKLANIMPIAEAVDYMKYMAKKSYLKKGEAVVEMNYKAIDAGVDALVKVEVPEAWKTAVNTVAEKPAEGTRKDLVDFVNNIVIPVTKMQGDSLPVSAFAKLADGQLPQGAAAYEKRGVAVDVPVWHAENCIQCNNCAFVCPHAAIRPFAMTEEEAANAPAVTKFAAKPVIKTNYKFTMAISPLDCMGCTLCVKACPVTAKAEKDGTPEKKAIEMVSLESQREQQADGIVDDLAVECHHFGAGHTVVAVIIRNFFHCDGLALRFRCSAEQIVTGYIVIVRDLDQKVQTALTDALFVVGKQCLRNAEIRCRLLLADLPFLALQRDDSWEICIHEWNAPFVYFNFSYILYYSADYTICKAAVCLNFEFISHQIL